MATARKKYDKAYYERNKESIIAAVRKHYKKNREAILAQKKIHGKEYRKLNREKESARMLKYLHSNPEARERKRLRDIEYYRKNKEKNVANCAKRRFRKKQQLPVWVDKEHLWIIKQIYELAQLRTKYFKFEWHVDHIIPLINTKVSGLHVYQNLRVIPAIENLKKRNKFEVNYG